MALTTGPGLDEPRTRVRLYVPADLAAGNATELGPEQAHYVTRVMRLGPGARVAVFNGRDGEWAAEIAAVTKSRCSLHVLSLRRAQARGPDVTLAFAPVKRQPLDLLVRQATELGVGRLQPVLTQRTIAERVNLDRLRAITVEAAEQCERLDLPLLAEPLPLDRFLAEFAAGARLLFCDETGRGRPIAAAVAAEPPAPACLLCGPEGGFTAAELDRLRDLPFATGVLLGPRILRAETAALAALAVWQACRGDWTSVPPPRTGSALSTDAGAALCET